MGGVLGSAGVGGGSRWVLHPPGAGAGSALWVFAPSESREAWLLQKRSLRLGGQSAFGLGAGEGFQHFLRAWGPQGGACLECPPPRPLPGQTLRNSQGTFPRLAGDVPHQHCCPQRPGCRLPRSSARAGTCVPSSEMLQIYIYLLIYIYFFFPAIKRFWGLCSSGGLGEPAARAEGGPAAGAEAARPLGLGELLGGDNKFASGC